MGLIGNKKNSISMLLAKHDDDVYQLSVLTGVLLLNRRNYLILIDEYGNG